MQQPFIPAGDGVHVVDGPDKIMIVFGDTVAPEYVHKMDRDAVNDLVVELLDLIDRRTD